MAAAISLMIVPGEIVAKASLLGYTSRSAQRELCASAALSAFLTRQSGLRCDW